MALLSRTHDNNTRYIESNPDTRVVNRAHPMTIVGRIIAFITSAILAVLAVRFVFVLLGANPSNGIANFVYSVSEPLVSPFFSLFNYEFVNGTARFEGFTLVAMLIYALVGYGLARLMTIGRPVREEV